MDITRLFPIGSVVKLHDATKRMMIIGILQEKEGVRYDYIGLLYPEGFIGDEYTFLFNHDDVAEVDFLGWIDAEHQLFRSNLNKVMSEQQ